MANNSNADLGALLAGAIVNRATAATGAAGTTGRALLAATTQAAARDAIGLTDVITALKTELSALLPTPAIAPALAAYNGNQIPSLDAFDVWLGRPADIQVVFFNQTSWTNFSDSINFIADLFGARRCIWSVPLSAEYGGLPSVVNGTRDALFTRCAQAILAKQAGTHPILIRTGWEFNLTSQEQRAFDGANPPNPTPAVWVAAWRRVIGLFRAVSPRFRFIWCSNIGNATADGLTVVDCYPGDDVVDMIGLDIYFSTNFGDVASDGGSGTFAFRKGQGAGLDWSVAFAAAHGKPWCVPEWGIQSNLAVNYMESFCKYLVDNKAVIQGYWDSDAAIVTKISNGALPAIGAIYRKYFARPSVTTPAISDSAQNINFSEPLTSNQDVVYPVTWEVVSGSAIVVGNLLTILGAPVGNSVVAVRPTSKVFGSAAPGLPGANFTITHTFKNPFVFTDTDAQAWIAARPTVASETLKAATNQLFIDLKASTAYAKARDIFVAVDTAAASNIGLKRVATRTAVNAPVFTPYEGFETAYDGAAPRYLKLGVVGQAPTPMAINSLWMLVWQRRAVADAAMGLPGSNAALIPRNGSGQTVLFANDYTALNVASADPRGIFSGIRSTSTARRTRKNGATIASDAQASGQADSASEWMEGGTNFEFPGSGQNRVVLLGSAPSDSEEAATGTALRNFYTALGAAA